MFYHDGKLQYPVRVDTPDPVSRACFSRRSVGWRARSASALQYLFQAFGPAGRPSTATCCWRPERRGRAHRDAGDGGGAKSGRGLVRTRTRRLGAQPVVGAIMGGWTRASTSRRASRHSPRDANGVPFNGSHVYASGNVAADMYANVTAESTGRALACRLYNLTDDPGMKDMLQLPDRPRHDAPAAVAGGDRRAGWPQGTCRSRTRSRWRKSCARSATTISLRAWMGWTSRRAAGRRANRWQRLGQFRLNAVKPMGEEPKLAPPMPQAYAEKQQMEGATEKG